MQLRRAGPDDAEAVRALTRLAYAKWVPVIGCEPIPMRADYERAVREHVIDMVMDGEDLVALIEMDERPDDVLIENIAVHPDHQGRGLGSRLIAHAETFARQRGTPVLRLYTNVRYPETIALYRRRGFLAEREEDVVPVGRIVHMVKML